MAGTHQPTNHPLLIYPRETGSSQTQKPSDKYARAQYYEKTDKIAAQCRGVMMMMLFRRFSVILAVIESSSQRLYACLLVTSRFKGGKPTIEMK